MSLREVLVTGLVGAAVGALAVYAGSDDLRYSGRQHIDLSDWVDRDDAWTRSMMPSARWATEELCGAALPCTQAVQSDALTMLRFAEQEDAVAAARDLAGEAYLSGWIVVRFEPGVLTRAERSEFAVTLDCTNVGITEDGVEC